MCAFIHWCFTFWKEKKSKTQTPKVSNSMPNFMPYDLIFEYEPEFHEHWSENKEVTCDKRQRRDSTWLRATESPMNAIFFPRTISKKAWGSNSGSSHFSGFHFQFRKSVSFLPFLKQFFDSGILLQLEFVYNGPLKSGTHWPLNKSHSSSSTKYHTDCMQII